MTANSATASTERRAATLCSMQRTCASARDSFCCEKCNRSFSSPLQFRLHHEGSHSNSQNSCDDCSELFTNSVGLANHVKSAHDGSNLCDHVCLNCYGRFKNRLRLKVHLLNCTHSKDQSRETQSTTVPRYQQVLCAPRPVQVKKQDNARKRSSRQDEKKSQPKWEQGDDSLGEVFEALHSSTESLDIPAIYPCLQCDEQFLSTDTLRRHNESTHTEPWPYRCTLCARWFKQYNNLKHHMSMHKLDYKPHCCPFCVYKSRLKSNLNKHIRTCRSAPQHMTGDELVALIKKPAERKKVEEVVEEEEAPEEDHMPDWGDEAVTHNSTVSEVEVNEEVAEPSPVVQQEDGVDEAEEVTEAVEDEAAVVDDSADPQSMPETPAVPVLCDIPTAPDIDSALTPEPQRPLPKTWEEPILMRVTRSQAKMLKTLNL